MNTRFLTSLVVVATALSALSNVSCNETDPAPQKPVVAPTPPARKPTAERALERSQARWNLAMKADWVAAYDFQTPEVKKMISLSQYLTQVQVHQYENAKALEVIGLEKDLAYVHVSTLWTPHHPNLERVKLAPGESLTQQVSMVETWRWVDGDWCFQYPPKRDDDFFKEHPELLKKSPEPAK